MQAPHRIVSKGSLPFQAAYLILWIGAFEALALLTLAVFFREPRPSGGWILVAYVLVLNAPIVQRLAEVALAIVTRPHDLPKKRCINSQPRVALLYCTCDDAVAECLRHLGAQTYPGCQVFILDDSQSEHYQNLIDQAGYRVVRRGTRKGFKAGNLNHWLHHYGSDFDYFVILDADSRLPETFVEDMLLYAEHPANRNVAFFESKILPYKPRTRLAQTLFVHSKISLFMAERLNNRLGITLSAGHNNLCRVHDIKSVGGFDEGFISEDHATTLNLLQKGKTCKLVNACSYEGVPENLSYFVRRAARWARSDVQLLAHKWPATSLVLQIHLFLKAAVHILWIPYLFGMFRITWGFRTTWKDVVDLVNYLVVEGGFLQPDVLPITFFLLVFVAYLYLAHAPIGWVLKLPAKNYLWHVIHGMCLGFATVIPVVWSLSKSFLRQPFPFNPTPKSSGSTSIQEYLAVIWPAIVLGLGVGLGVFHNPAVLLFNWLWILPLAATPFILYESS